MKKRTSQGYIFTASVDSAVDMEKIALVRKTVSLMNKQRADAIKRGKKFGYEPRVGLKMRVLVKGRLGKDNPNAVKYRGRGSAAYQTILMADAASYDVYMTTVYN